MRRVPEYLKRTREITISHAREYAKLTTRIVGILTAKVRAYPLWVVRLFVFLFVTSSLLLVALLSGENDFAYAPLAYYPQAVAIHPDVLDEVRFSEDLYEPLQISVNFTDDLPGVHRLLSKKEKERSQWTPDKPIEANCEYDNAIFVFNTLLGHFMKDRVESIPAPSFNDKKVTLRYPIRTYKDEQVTLVKFAPDRKFNASPVAEYVNYQSFFAEHSGWYCEKMKLYTEPPLPATTPPSYAWKQFYIALNLHRSYKLIPYIAGALLAFIRDEIAPFYDVASSVVISIYLNKQKDPSEIMVHTLLLPYLDNVGVRKIFLTTRGVCIGHNHKKETMDRIMWLSCVRNAAMRPLYTYGMNLYGKGNDGDATHLVVLFLNDILFRPRDLTALLESRPEATFAASTLPDGLTAIEQSANGEACRDGPDAATAAADLTATSFDMACGMDFYTNFYDTWVARDRRGNHLNFLMPYSSDRATRDALRRIVGANGNAKDAVAVKACWGGVSAIRGSLFLPITPTLADRTNHLAGTVDRSVKANVAAATSDAPFTIILPRKLVPIPRAEAEIMMRGFLRRLFILHHQAMGFMFSYYISHREVNFCEGHETMFRPCFPTAGTNSTDALVHNLVYSYVERLRPVPTSVSYLRANLFGRGSNPPKKDAVTSGIAANISDGTVFYREESPVVRFRSSAVPSYGARARGKYKVREDVCYSSECLLLPQDIAQAVLLRENRTPVILMNPTVRVAYDKIYFNFITWASRLYTSSLLFRVMSFLYDVNFIHDRGLSVFWREWRLANAEAKLTSALRTATSSCPISEHAWKTVQTAAQHYLKLQAESVGARSSIVVTFEGHTVLPPVDSSNDWILGSEQEDQIIPLDVGQRGAAKFVQYYNVTQLTYMACYYPHLDNSRQTWDVIERRITFLYPVSIFILWLLVKTLL